MAKGKRVFRGKCPYESIFEIELGGDCRNCRYFKPCLGRERRRKRRAKHRRDCLLAWSALIAMAVVIIFILTAIINFLINTFNGDIKENTPQQITTIVIEPIDPDKSIRIQVENSVIESELQNAESDLQFDVVELHKDKDTEAYTEEETQIAQARISAYELGEKYYYNLSYEEKVYIAKVVYAEARGEIFEGQVAVAATVLNRYTSDDKRFCRESIYSVITQSGQFASIVEVTIEDLNAVPTCMEAVEAACKGWDPTRVVFSDGAKFFFNPDGDLDELARKEREGVLTYKIGRHLFHNDFNVVS